MAKKNIDLESFQTTPDFVGKDVYLRPTAPEDTAHTYRWFLASEPQSQSCHEMPLISPAQYVERMKKREPKRDEGDFVIVRIEDNQLVGKLRYFHLNMLNRSAELGYIVAPDARKEGYAKEGLMLLIRYLFSGLNLNKVYAQTASFNKASNKLLESLDFKIDGTLRQHHYYKGDLYDDLLYSLLKFECSFLG
jgi:RimJ/RimL family protein N-acetyltransferase